MGTVGEFESATLESIADPEVHQPFIDGLRGISILMVVFIHLSLFVSPGQTITDNYFFKSGFSVFWSAVYGVRLFFLVSAYTLFRSYTRRQKLEHRPVTNFYIRRAFRILPLFWGWVLLYGIWGPQSHDPNSILTTLFFVMVFLRGILIPEVWSGAWSIYVEECFYFFFPALFRHINSLPKAFLWTCIGWILASAWETFAAFARIPTDADFINLFPLDNFFCFFLGILIYHVADSGYFKKLKDASPTTVVGINMAVLIALQQLMTLGHRQATMALSLVFISSFSEKTLFGKIARLKIIKKFGVYCYSIYLMHQLILFYLRDPIQVVSQKMQLPLSVEFRTFFWFPGFCLLMLVLGKISFQYLEIPLISFAKSVIAIREMKATRATPRDG